MKREIARGLFLVAALAVASVAMAAWQEPRAQVLGADEGEGIGGMSKAPKAQTTERPDHSLLLLMFGLAQAKKAG
jgi:hypothetical protein